MSEIKKKDLLVKYSVSYFVAFLILPFILGHIFRRMDLYMYYMFFVFSGFSVVYVVLCSSFFKLTKKNWLLIIGLILLSYILSAVYMYILFGMAFMNSNFSF